VILINLLPHREIARKRRKDMFNAGLGAAALAGGLLAGVAFLWIHNQTSQQQDRNLTLTNEIKKFDAQIKDIAGLEAEIAALKARQQAVEDLQSDRNMPVYLLTELVTQLPEGVYVTNMVQTGQSVTLKGVAQSNERVSELLRNLGGRSVWFDKPELVEIVAGSVSLGARDQRRVSNFTVRVKLLRASEAKTVPTTVSAADASGVAKPVAVASAPTPVAN